MRETYTPPTVTSIPAAEILEALGPVTAGSSAPAGRCGPLLPNYCPNPF